MSPCSNSPKDPQFSRGTVFGITPSYGSPQPCCGCLLLTAQTSFPKYIVIPKI